jgi:predicted nucleic acid-binding protein
MTDGSPVGVYLDTNVFIELLDRQSATTPELWRLFGPEAGRSHQIVTSDLTLSEILVGAIDQALESGDYAKYHLFMDSLVTKGNAQILAPVDRDTLVEAASIRAHLPRLTGRKIKLPDAIHIAAALRAKCSFFVTGDHRLHRAISDMAAGKGRAKGSPDAPPCEAIDISLQDIQSLLTRLAIK